MSTTATVLFRAFAAVVLFIALVFGMGTGVGIALTYIIAECAP